MIKSRLLKIREILNKYKASAILIPSNDPHQSEYPPEYWKIREWSSGFTGSAGLLIVTSQKAGLWTDSRYFIQAEKELSGSSIDLHKVLDRFAPGHLEWLCSDLEPGQTVLVLEELTAYNSYQKMKAKLEALDLKLKPIKDPYSEIWQDRPSLPDDEIFEHPIEFASHSRIEKLTKLRDKMQEKSADFLLLTALDDIAWTLNLRSTDVECNPVFISYLLIGRSTAELFVLPGKINTSLKEKLVKDKISVKDYHEIRNVLHSLDDNDRIILDENQTNCTLYEAVSKADIIKAISPVELFKACKSEKELAHFRNCMVKDGVALCHAFKWLEDTINRSPVTEYDFAMKLAEYRSRQDRYYGESFNAIVGYNENGAIVHYRPLENSSAVIRKEGVLLVDSGGQYMDGTSDITRTIALGPPSAELRKNFTLVLKGNIELAMSRFPKSTSGNQLDILARRHLWNAGLSFSHGTGHGVGFFNNVHEGPQSISPGPRASQAIIPGMVTSNEPGYYKEGSYGIRIENLIVCVESDFSDFLEFETITLFPVDTSLIDKLLLGSEALNWLNNYHDRVYDSLSPHLDEEHKKWLSHKCQHI